MKRSRLVQPAYVFAKVWPTIEQYKKHYLSRKPSAIREAQITFSKRLDKDTVNVINLAIGNITLPIHPSMKKRLDSLGITRFKDGVIKYTPTVGTKEAQDAFINILKSEKPPLRRLFF